MRPRGSWASCIWKARAPLRRMRRSRVSGSRKLPSASRPTKNKGVASFLFYKPFGFQHASPFNIAKAERFCLLQETNAKQRNEGERERERERVCVEFSTLFKLRGLSRGGNAVRGLSERSARAWETSFLLFSSRERLSRAIRSRLDLL